MVKSCGSSTTSPEQQIWQLIVLVMVIVKIIQITSNTSKTTSLNIWGTISTNIQMTKKYWKTNACFQLNFLVFKKDFKCALSFWLQRWVENCSAFLKVWKQAEFLKIWKKAENESVFLILILLCFAKYVFFQNHKRKKVLKQVENWFVFTIEILPCIAKNKIFNCKIARDKKFENRLTIGQCLW